MNANDNEGHDSRQDDMLAEHQRPEDRAPLAGDGKRYPDGSWQALADEDDTQPVSFSDRVQFAPPSVLVGCPPLPSEQEARIAELEAELGTARRLLFDVDKGQDIEGLGGALNAVHSYLISIGMIER